MLAATAVRAITLPSGEAVPALGQGTWHLAEDVRLHRGQCQPREPHSARAVSGGGAGKPFHLGHMPESRFIECAQGRGLGRGFRSCPRIAKMPAEAHAPALRWDSAAPVLPDTGARFGDLDDRGIQRA
jgi:hypothetical protein